MTQNVNLRCSESKKVILINTEEEKQAVSSMTLEPEPLSPNMPLRVNELAYVICDEVATGNLIRCSDWRNVVHYLCTSLPAHQIYNLISSNRKFTCANRTEEEYKNIVQLITDSALIEFQEKLDQLEVEMHPL